MWRAGDGRRIVPSTSVHLKFGYGSIFPCLLVVLLVSLLLMLGCGTKEEPFVPLSEEPEGKIERVDGEALVHRAGTRAPVHLRLGDPLFQGDLVVTHGSACVDIRLVDGSVLMVRPLSRLKLNERMPGEKEAPSAMLFHGRVLSRVLNATGGEMFWIETPLFVARARGTEFEVGVSEDLGALIAVYHGKVEALTEGESLMLGAQKEAEIEFMGGPASVRAFKDKGETEWAAWMVSKSRGLAGSLSVLANRIPACVSELRTKQRDERSTLTRRLEEAETLARQIGEARARGDARELDGLVRRFQETCSEHTQCIKRLQTVGNRVESLYVHAEHLVSRAKGLKKELGGVYEPVVGSLNRMQEGKKEALRAVEDDRILLRNNRKHVSTLLEAVPEAKAALKEPRDPEPKADPAKEKATVQPQKKTTAGSPKRLPGGSQAVKEGGKSYSPTLRTSEKKPSDKPQGKRKPSAPPPTGTTNKGEQKAR